MEYDDLYETYKVVSEAHRKILSLKMTDEVRLRHLKVYYGDLHFYSEQMGKSGLYSEEQLREPCAEWKPVFREILDLENKLTDVLMQNNPKFARELDEEFERVGLKKYLDNPDLFRDLLLGEDGDDDPANDWKKN